MSHRSSGLPGGPVRKLDAVQWEASVALDQWLSTQPTSTWKDFFDKNGYLVVRDLIGPYELSKYRDVIVKLLTKEIDASSHRHDLGNHKSQQVGGEENVCQIMWPTLFVDKLDQGPIHERAGAVARIILGDDVIFDFDMLMSKAPHTNTETPWHQDESYWIEMEDKRAVSCWCALDDVTVDNGCMWFVSGSHRQGLREHHPIQTGCHVLTCPGTEAEGAPQPLAAGSATFHHARTMHYSRGNSTDSQRRALVSNFRPAAMVEYERQKDYDYGRSMGVDGILTIGQGHGRNTVILS